MPVIGVKVFVMRARQDNIILSTVSTAVFILTICNPVHSDLGECYSYCDTNNDLHPGFSCDKAPNLYCCGNKTTRYCCSDVIKDVSNRYSAICLCPNYECVYTGWETMFAIILLVLFGVGLALCCCHLFSGTKFSCLKSSLRRVARRAQRVESTTSSEAEVRERPDSEPSPESHDIFNPSHPFAFSPPAYDTLDKDLPQYDQLYASTSGASAQTPTGLENLAFDSEELHLQSVGRQEEHVRRRDGESEEDSHVGERQQQQIHYTQGDHRVVIALERGDSELGPPDSSPRGTPPPPYENESQDGV